MVIRGRVFEAQELVDTNVNPCVDDIFIISRIEFFIWNSVVRVFLIPGWIVPVAVLMEGKRSNDVSCQMYFLLAQPGICLFICVFKLWNWRRVAIQF